MKTYKLTFKDKLYLCIQEDNIKRYAYLYPKVEQHQLKWFEENGIRLPIDFNRYIKNYVENLIFEYESQV